MQVWFQNKRARWRRRVNDNPPAVMATASIMSPPPQNWTASGPLLSPPFALMSPPPSPLQPPYISQTCLPLFPLIMQNKDMPLEALDQEFVGSRQVMPCHSIPSGIRHIIGQHGPRIMGVDIDSGHFSQSSLLQLRKAAQLHVHGMKVSPPMPYGTI